MMMMMTDTVTIIMTITVEYRPMWSDARAYSIVPVMVGGNTS